MGPRVSLSLIFPSCKSHQSQDCRRSLRSVDSGIWDRFAGEIFHRGSVFRNEAPRVSLSLLIIKMEQAWPGGPTVLFFHPSSSSSFLPLHLLLHLLPTPPSQLPHDVTSPLPGNASSLGDGKKGLHCFAAFHSSCLKVPASEGGEDGFLSFFFLSCAPPHLSLSLSVYASNCNKVRMHIRQGKANMYCVNVHTGEAVTTGQGEGGYGLTFSCIMAGSSFSYMFFPSLCWCWRQREDEAVTRASMTLHNDASLSVPAKGSASIYSEPPTATVSRAPPADSVRLKRFLPTHPPTTSSHTV